MLARFFAAAVLVGLGSCSTTLPPQRPVDFLIRLREDGGMVNRGLELQVSADLSYIDEWDGDRQSLILFEAGPDLLDGLYQLARDRRADRITFRVEQEVYDRGGYNLHMEADGRKWDIRDSGMSFVGEAWRTEFAALKQGVLSIIEAAGDEPSVPLTFQSAETLPDLDLSVRFSGRTLVRVDNAVFPDHVRLGHGSYAMIVEYRWTPAAGEALRSVRHETQVDVTPSTRRVVVELGRGAARIVAE